MTAAARSKNDLPIRLTEERWEHIVTQHAELAEYRDRILAAVADPQRILAGSEGELIAIREVEVGKWLVVVYRELVEDGFIITAFLTRRRSALDRRQVLWSP